jgi:translation initiation factor 5A
MSVNYATLGELKKGSYIVIDGEPCRIVEITKAKTGKHGSAKAHVVAIGVFSGQKKTLVAPVDTRVQIPIIEKRVGQIIADMGDTVQVMDMETYDTFRMCEPKSSKTGKSQSLEKLSLMCSKVGHFQLRKLNTGAEIHAFNRS